MSSTRSQRVQARRCRWCGLGFKLGLEFIAPAQTTPARWIEREDLAAVADAAVRIMIFQSEPTFQHLPGAGPVLLRESGSISARQSFRASCDVGDVNKFRTAHGIDPRKAAEGLSGLDKRLEAGASAAQPSAAAWP